MIGALKAEIVYFFVVFLPVVMAVRLDSRGLGAVPACRKGARKTVMD